MSDIILDMVGTGINKETEEVISNVVKENETTLDKKDTENISEVDAKNNTQDELRQFVMHVDDLKKKDGKRIYHRDYSVYGYYGGDPNKANPPITVVQVMGIEPKYIPPSDGEPLNYDPSSRNSFVKLVFSIVLLMLLTTAGFNVLVYTDDDLTHVFRKYNFLLLICACIMMISLSYAVGCSECTRVVPCNFIVLALSVIAMSILSACTTVRYRTEIIFYAFIATSAVVMICLILAFTRFDFTKLLIFVIVIMGVIAAISLIMMVVKLATGVYMKPLHMVILFVGALVQSVMLIIELQMILGGKTVELSEKDYAMGAFMLYTSIMDLFIKLVLLIAGIDSS